MSIKFKFKNDEPVIIFTDGLIRSENADILEYTDGTKILVLKTTDHRCAVERIKYISQKTKDNPVEAEKFKFAIVQYMDADDEENFNLLLQPFSEWHSVL